jgi:hypothetical protein
MILRECFATLVVMMEKIILIPIEHSEALASLTELLRVQRKLVQEHDRRGLNSFCCVFHLIRNTIYQQRKSINIYHCFSNKATAKFYGLIFIICVTHRHGINNG